MEKLLLLGLILAVFTTGCIKDDILFDTQEPELRITNAPDTLEVNSNYTFEAMYLNNVGQSENVDLSWTSLDENTISIANDGFATALQLGSTTIRAEYDNGTEILTDEVSVQVGESTVINSNEFSGTVNTTSSYVLTGDFTIAENGDDLLLEFSSDYEADTGLPGLYVYLSNNPNSNADAYEIGAVQIFSGAHSYTIPNTSIFDYNYVLYYCKPFGVKVGHGEIIQ